MHLPHLFSGMSLLFSSSPVISSIMWKLFTVVSLFGLLVSSCEGAVNTTGLKLLLSPGATISNNGSSAPRWSDFDAPTPGAVVTVATEQDVLRTVQYCIALNIPFFAQNGGHGWSTTINLKQNGITINLAGIKAMSIDSAKSAVTFQGGALISDVVNFAYNNSVLVPTGTCNCVGTLGAILGGGFGNLMGQYGFGVDNLVSLNVVTPLGTAITVSPTSYPDLWYAMRGAGANFGIVTSAVIKSYPTNAAGLTAWHGPLIFLGTSLEALIGAMGNLTMQPKMAMELFFLLEGGQPIILLNLFYYGTEADGRAAFASILAVGPIADETAILTYDQWNAGGDGFCTKGERKPSFGAGLAKLDPTTWRAVWNKWLAFASLPGAETSAVILDVYSLVKPRTFADSSSAYPFRHTVNYNAIATGWYPDSTLDAQAEAFGFAARDLWRSTSGLPVNSTYINNGFGDEALSVVYGQSLSQLQTIKKHYDPLYRFNQWFPIK
ncbi:FAD-linked oxidoreductase azaL [Lachnellula suecica]|uniref:FAD-linked oxidoreductase azaL n=1 Tax=Lachnellula suecica TaxID=602035 RepID=A0A8T9BYW5_9HELO|nr:FAD-linked oxidoreductase azaL [Lachnellula suecica]